MAGVRHRKIVVDGTEIFYREAGPVGAPVVLLPHGYPSSSYEFRNLMEELGDRYRLLAPDFPGSGYSATPQTFDYTFDGFAAFLGRFADAVEADRFVLYMHDFGNWIALRLAMSAPNRVLGMIIQNGDVYEDALGPDYEGLIAYWDDPTPGRRAALAEAISEDGFRKEFLNGSEAVADRVPPDLWTLHWALATERRRIIHHQVIADLRENRAWFVRYQAFLRERRYPTLILWGPNDGYMPEAAGLAYRRDLPDAEIHMFADAGHWLLETHLDEAVPLIRRFLDRVTREAAPVRDWILSFTFRRFRRSRPKTSGDR